MELISINGEFEKEPEIQVNKYLKFLGISIGFISGLLIFTTQLNLSIWLFWSGFITAIISPIILHFCDKRIFIYPNKYINKYLGPIAVFNIYSLLLTLIILNVIWALRWLAGPEVVVRSIYGVSEQDTNKMKRCGIDNPYVQKSVSCDFILSSFLAHPIGIYLHCIGGVLALGLGPFQLWKDFRKNHKQTHKIMGYFYIFGVILGTIGAILLIIRTTNGAGVASAFALLAFYWILTLSKAILEIRKKRIEEHQIWMIRNYFMTFGAVPFRFVPLMFHSFGVNKFLAYDIGAWITIVLMVMTSEIYIRKIRD